MNKLEYTLVSILGGLVGVMVILTVALALAGV
jgi:hypothetical protein